VASGDEHKTGGYNLLKVRLSPHISEDAGLGASIAFALPYGFWPGGEGSQLDRAYLDLYFPRFDLTVGKQRISWGSSYIWAPLDAFNRINFIEPKGEREGVNAVRAYIPLGTLSGASAVFAPESNFSESRKGLRISSNVSGVDVGLSFIASGKEWLSGVDLRGDMEIGWWCELVGLRRGDSGSFKGVLGGDYTFDIGNGLYVLSEYFHDGSGEPEKSRYEFSKLAERNTLARDYLFSLCTYPLNGNLAISASLTLNVNDGTGIFNPYVRYGIFQDVSWTFGAYIFFGPRGGEFRPPRKADPSGIMGRDMAFSWLRVDF